MYREGGSIKVYTIGTDIVDTVLTTEDMVHFHRNGCISPIMK